MYGENMVTTQHKHKSQDIKTTKYDQDMSQSQTTDQLKSVAKDFLEKNQHHPSM